MKKLFIFALLVGFSQAEPGWNPDNAYIYSINSQSLSTFDEWSNEYHGVIMKASVQLQRGTLEPASLIGKLQNVQYSEIQTTSSDECFVPNVDNSLIWETFNTSNATFEVILDNGVVKTLLLRGNITIGEANIIRAVVSQLQTDLQGKNAMESKTLNRDYRNDKSNMQFSTMEESIIGHCETMYDISRLSKYAMRNKHSLAPLLNASEDYNSIIDIMKISNFSNCKQHSVYHRGINGRKNWDAGLTSVGDVITRQAEARIIINGTLENYTIHSSVVTEKMLISLSLYKKEKAMLISCMNLTLQVLRNAEALPSLSNETQTTLLYDYEYHSTENIDVTSSSSNDGDPQHQNHTARHTLRQTTLQSSLKHRQQRDAESSLPENTTEDNNASDVLSTTPSDTIITNEGTTVSAINENSTMTPNADGSSFETSTAPIVSETTDTTDIEITSSTTNLAPTTSDIISTTLESDSVPNDNVSDTFTDSINTNDTNYVNITNVLQSLNMPKDLENPLLSSFFSMYPSVQNKSTLLPKEIEIAIKTVSEEIASHIMDFKTIINKNILNTFCELTFLIANTNFEVLQTVSHILYEAKQSNENSQQLVWMVFRDAVTQAGTGPSLMLIKEWILSNKINSGEAADIIEQLPSTAEIPNELYIDSLFEIVKHPHIRMQESLNVSAILAFTNLVRQVFVDRYARKALYPVHVFSPMIQNETKVNDVYLQYLQEQLENAVINEDSCKIHIYIKAIGNVAHLEILNIFKQYVTNDTKMTIFQRVLIVASLDKIAELHPTETQNFLFSIYIDEREHYEVRTCAVVLLMHTKPPGNILKRIVEFTQFDLSNQVIAAVKSSILAAAELTNPEDAEFKHNAKSVMGLLNPKKLGIHYSANFFKTHKWTFGNLGLQNSMNYIGSDNSIIPKGFFINYERYLGGLQPGKEQYGILFSDIKKISHIIENLWNVPTRKFGLNLNDNLSNQHENDQLGNETLSQENSSVNATDRSDSQEGNNSYEELNHPESMLLFHLANAEKIVTFGKNYSSSIERWLQQKLKNLKSGYKFSYNKLFQKEKFLYAVPNVAGHITQVIYKVPSIYHLTGKIKLNARQHKIVSSDILKQFPQELNFTGQFNLGYSFNKHTDFGFVTPFNGNRYTIGYKEQLLLNIPTRINVTATLNSNCTKIATTFAPSTNNSLGFYSQFNSELYRQHDTVSDIVKKQKISSPKVIQKQPCEQIIKEFGGLLLNISLQPKTHEHPPSEGNDLFSFFNLWTNQKSIGNKNMILRANFPSTTSSVTINMQFANLNDNILKRKVATQDVSTRKHGNHRYSSRNTDNNKKNDELLNNTIVTECSIFFNQNKKSAYMLNFNYTWSEFTNNTKFNASLYQKNSDKNCKNCHPEHMLTLMLDGTWRKVLFFNFSKAFSFNPKSDIKAVLQLGSSKISTASMKCNLLRTSARKVYVREQQESKKCLEEMQDGNLILPSCQHSIINANYLNQHNCTIEVNEHVKQSKSYTNFLQIIQTLAFKYLDNYPREPPGPKNQISFLTHFEPNFECANVTIMFPNTEATFKNINIHPLFRPIVKIHPSHSALTRTGQDLLADQYQPTCVLDKNKMNTFDNKTYTIKLGTCWYVLMSLTLEKTTNTRLSESDILILVRDNIEGRAIRLLIRGDVIDIASQSSSKKTFDKNIYVNKEQYPLFTDRFTKISLHSQNSNFQLQGTIVDEKIKLHFVNVSTYIVFDGIRIMLTTGNRYRNQTLGLCGTFNGEDSDDFILPTHCNVSDPQLFSASYAIINNNTCSEQALELANDAINKSCSVTSDIYLDTDFPKAVSCSNNYNRKPDPRCMIRYIHVEQDDDRYTCFSKNSLPKCKATCYPINIVKKDVRFHCVVSSIVSKHFVDAIRSGKLHDFSTKKTTKTISMNIPTGCYKC